MRRRGGFSGFESSERTYSLCTRSRFI
ncbi:hypothetical protein AB1N83_013188 [Pleurotus pulmonarius]